MDGGGLAQIGEGEKRGKFRLGRVAGDSVAIVCDTATLRQKRRSKPMAQLRRTTSSRVSPSGRQLRVRVMVEGFRAEWYRA
jgi:hypothetical protein